MVHASGYLCWTLYVITHGMSSMVLGVGDVCERAEKMHRLGDKSGLEHEARAYTRTWT